MIAIDLENFDPNLHELGDGAHRKDGAIIMVGLYDGKDYACCRPDDPRLPDWLASDEDKIFHNGIYDLSWLICGYGFKVGGTWHDTMTRCSLVNEYMNLDLDTCCKKFKVAGKNFEDTLEAWFDSVKKQWGLRGKVWDNLDVVSAFPEGWAALEKYNRQDCKATYDLFMATEPYMRDVREPYELECALYPLWIDMKKRGVRIDKLRMERFHEEINRLKILQEQQLYHEYGVNLEIIASNKKMSAAMSKIGVKSPNTTSTGNQSWDVKSLPLIDHPVVPMIMNLKNLDYISGNKGIEKLAQCIVGDRIYTTFSPNKRDEGGTVTGRLGSRAPNLQNIPSREDAYGQKAWGPEMRSLFLPDEGHNMVAAVDYGQIEFRLMAHFSVGAHAEWFRDQCRNPKIDMHAIAMERTGIESRYIIKRINFGVPYGMGIKRMVNLDYPVFKKAATEHGYDDAWEYGNLLYQQFKTGFPVLFDMMANIEQTVRTQGYIKSLGGRIRHKPPVEQNQYGGWSVPYYKMTSHMIQGSAAEMLKQGLCLALKAGVFDVLPCHLSVHDENVVSVPFEKIGIEAIEEMKHCMETAYADKLTVPFPASCELGPNWGYWSSDIYEEMKQGIFDETAFQRVYAPKVKASWWCIKNGYNGLDGQVKLIQEEKFTQ
jgi:DNA polymerase I-like protein with 3'-5' exonuclease and polymerase domains